MSIRLAIYALTFIHQPGYLQYTVAHPSALLYKLLPILQPDHFLGHLSTSLVFYMTVYHFTQPQCMTICPSAWLFTLSAVHQSGYLHGRQSIHLVFYTIISPSYDSYDHLNITMLFTDMVIFLSASYL
jgi:hypothetical protein